MTNDAAKVGIATIIISEVTRIAQLNRDIFINGKSGCFIFSIVTTKLMAPKTEDRPSNFNEIIHKSAAGPGAFNVEYGG
jgi:hypothetical protein